MTHRSNPPQARRAVATACALAALTLAGSAAFASSHREAPGITESPKVDATDLYMFRSYETGRQDFVTILANYIPFQDPQGGPNFFMFDDQALYEINIDNDGDGKEDLTFRFRFNNTSKGQALTVGGKQIKIPLINSGVLTQEINPPKLNVRETFSVELAKNGRRSNSEGKLAFVSGGATVFDKPVDNIGEKTFGDAALNLAPGKSVETSKYASYAKLHIYNVTIPGCGNGKVFVGQRKEPFYIAVGKIFDLFNLNPLGLEVNGNDNDLEYKNVSTIALEVPIACLTKGSEPVIGAWTTASKRQGHLYDPAPGPGLGKSKRGGGAWSQVSRLGMPLVNEVVIGLDDKDKFNASRPKDDAQFIDYVTNPVLPTLIESLFPAAKAPTNFPRTDLVTVFLKGIEGLNQPKGVVASEMMRLNTSIAPKAAAAQLPLGVAAGDNAGFPNGRRPGDDVVDASIRVAMGALCFLTGATDTLKVGCKPSDALAGGLALTDGVRRTAADYLSVFPYLTTPLPGNFSVPDNLIDPTK